LLRRGYDVSIGTFPRIDAEIDFVANEPFAGQAYIQVSESVVDQATFQRELAPYARLRDGYPRVLISKDFEDYSTDGVKHVNYYSFLLGQGLP
jgi:polyisoprenoid-binding protein YceI